MQDYLTVSKRAEDRFEEKRSKFIGYVCPVTTVEEATSFIESIKSKHWDAKHNVYAYVLREGNVQRFSDDGEPQGTAGIPALDVLLKNNVTDVCVVITRYFGGILLGGGGLVRAYSHSASLALQAAGIVHMVPCYEMTMTCDYTFYGRVPALMAQFEAELTDTVFTEEVRVSFLVPVTQCNAFQAELTNQSAGRFCAEQIGETYRCVPVNESM